MTFDKPDAKKAKTNLNKHGVSFEEAQEVFSDLDRIESFQRVDGEDRWSTIGRSSRRMLVVIYTERREGVRIISARKAEKRESARYRNR